MSTLHQVSPGVRQVLTAPRGHRFTRTRTVPQTGTYPTPPATLEEFFGQPTQNPRVHHRMEHGEPPHRMKSAAQQSTERERAARQQQEGKGSPRVPRPRPAPDDGPRPAPPPLPRRPHSHRKPRRRLRWTLIGYTLTATAGALAHHLATLLF